MSGLTINALCAGYDKRRIIEHLSISTLSFARRAGKVMFLLQSLPQGMYLRVLESVVVTQCASDARQNQAQAIALPGELGVAYLAMGHLGSLSGGRKQLVGLAQSLTRRPALLLLDEPLSALDLSCQFYATDIVSCETRRRNMVTLIVLHDINTALRHAAQVIILKEGKLIDSGNPQAVIHAESLAQVYGARGRVEHCAQGRSVVIVDGAIEEWSDWRGCFSLR